jgi:hypothetical protein
VSTNPYQKIIILTVIDIFTFLFLASLLGSTSLGPFGAFHLALLLFVRSFSCDTDPSHTGTQSLRSFFATTPVIPTVNTATANTTTANTTDTANNTVITDDVVSPPPPYTKVSLYFLIDCWLLNFIYISFIYILSLITSKYDTSLV